MGLECVYFCKAIKISYRNKKKCYDNKKVVTKKQCKEN